MYYNNKKLALSIFWIVLGAVLMVLSVTGVLDSSVYSGFGGAMIAVGVLQVIRNIKYRNNAEYREKMDVEATDERNRFIRMKSWSWTGYIVVLIEGIGVVAAMVFGRDDFRLVLSYSVCLILVVYLAAFFVLSRKY